MKAMRLLRLAWASLAALAAAPVLADLPEYRVTRTPWVGDTYGLNALAINNTGQVAGEAPLSQGWIWNGTALTMLGGPGLEASLAALNSAGWGVGATRIATTFEQNHAFLWDGSTMTRLAEPPGTVWSRGRAINDNGQIVMEVAPGASPGTTRSYLLNGSTFTDLGTLGGPETRTYDMNNAGYVVGWSRATPNGPSRAVLWDGHTLTDLAAAIPSTLPGGDSIAFAINDSHQIVGSVQAGGPSAQAYLWEGSTFTNLGALGGFGSAAYDINSRGQVVGFAQTPGAFGDWHGFLWDREGGMVDLNDLLESPAGWSIHRATKINDAGQILAAGTDLATGEYCWNLLLTPVPEPATAALWIVGLTLAAARAGRRRR